MGRPQVYRALTIREIDRALDRVTDPKLTSSLAGKPRVAHLDAALARLTGARPLPPDVGIHAVDRLAWLLLGPSASVGSVRHYWGELVALGAKGARPSAGLAAALWQQCVWRGWARGSDSSSSRHVLGFLLAFRLPLGAERLLEILSPLGGPHAAAPVRWCRRALYDVGSSIDATPAVHAEVVKRLRSAPAGTANAEEWGGEARAIRQYAAIIAALPPDVSLPGLPAVVAEWLASPDADTRLAGLRAAARLEAVGESPVG